MSNTDASGEKRVTGTSERRDRSFSVCDSKGVCRLTICRHVWRIYCDDPQRSGVSGKAGDAVRAYGGALICDSTTPSVEHQWKIKAH